MFDTENGAQPGKKEYLVLARKYRPQNFSELIGQDALIRTITNAINTNRVAHAFILTGIRGVGKTTSARIIAKALNCVGPEGNGGPTANPCGTCTQCKSISEGRNVDVIETDAASRTGVNDIREIIDNVQYMPVGGRYKIYIIDEVHMLSKSAFNALLKTLEEPPQHVKFIFATTEIRKIPLTILSRCQRFDLARVETDVLANRLKEIAGLESYTIEDGAASLIAKAAEGSVRDALSILDRAISSSEGGVTEDYVRELLGISDSSKIFDVFELIASGDVKNCLSEVRQMYKAGADVNVIFEDLLELTHFLTQLKINPEAGKLLNISENEIKKATYLSERLSIPFLVRCWQILLKGVGEVKIAPNPLAAAEMVVVKLCYFSELPTPDELIRKLRSSSAGESSAGVEQVKEKSPEPTLMKQQVSIQGNFKNFAEIVKLFEDKEPLIHAHLISDVHFVSLDKNRLEIRPTSSAPKDLAGRIMECLSNWMGERWLVSISNEKGAPTIREKLNEHLQNEKTEAQNDPLLKYILSSFPGSVIKSATKREEVDIQDIEEKNRSSI